ncbi:MAG: transketolase [Candidatus Omnitrophica bacterium CG_4_10_14_0_2_um_filter_44_9]|nr:MAG: transketolase [Candidatus Omnitrophica bacterium CG_4_10_14_0_8_um_filter_44_12]PIZ83689.1 MAG: transketolase [Candidatus Omnitrophica bacterium CG_4_10_14_0_2_um_filter_44_9]
MAEMLYARDVYGKTLIELGKRDKSVVVCDADLSGSTRTGLFAKEFPKRFFNFGVAEQDMMATAAGMASCGKVVFVSTFAMFASGRAWDQVRNTICYGGFDVKIVATHAGVTVGPDGASHQALEDIAILRAIPSIRIIVPADGPETREAVIAAFETKGPFYIRLGRSKVPTIEGRPVFQLGKGCVLRQGSDVTIVACGIMAREALAAYDALSKEKISARVINMPSIKPIDEELLIEAASSTRGFVVCEEHSVIGGLSSAVAEVLSEKHPARIVRIGVKNRFGQSGDEKDLMREYHLTSNDIVSAAKTLI